MQSTAESITMAREAAPQAREQVNPADTAHALLAEIAADAADHPDVYLRHTVVPEGGE